MLSLLSVLHTSSQQRIVLTAEETTVTQRVTSRRPFIKILFRSWSQEVRRSTGQSHHHLVTTCYSNEQGSVHIATMNPSSQTNRDLHPHRDNPARGHKEVHEGQRVNHIMVTTRYSNRQEPKIATKFLPGSTARKNWKLYHPRQDDVMISSDTNYCTGSPVCARISGFVRQATQETVWRAARLPKSSLETTPAKKN